MLPRAKTAHTFRVLGSNTSQSRHQDAEIEYSLIKGIVEAYSQRCPPNFNLNAFYTPGFYSNNLSLSTFNNCNNSNGNDLKTSPQRTNQRLPLRASTETNVDITAVPALHLPKFRRPAKVWRDRRPHTSASKVKTDRSEQENFRDLRFGPSFGEYKSHVYQIQLHFNMTSYIYIIKI